ncbi:Methyltransferase domain-containing protein [Acetitomaculum ruminis DSM 5522]|uniref:Methyltransferase domain-containing protein n=1 Tax=Acetitomaculum ruminis DSM 5522 TaxID=1120918 RepID=A0A1I0WPG7_9FIRM|nr:class I SAM-dependent methyltransferase [Acetitomaculum ruminis]SFA90050.1 Methyltransferase domain-containing protein [Acetitomaculum ruminis DSM 5522]
MKNTDLNSEVKGYWEGEANTYDTGIQAELESERKDNWKRLVLDEMPDKKELEILDVGTGPGFFPIILGEEGHHVTGIDITKNMITVAKRNAEKYNVTAKLLTMDSQKLDFEDNTFDAVICRNLTWTLDDPETAYKEWKRVLKEDGVLLIFDACWYLYNYDDELGKIYRENEAKIWEKYHRRIHEHANAEEGVELGKKLFMSDKRRPLWDLKYLMEIGFSKVFAKPDVSLLARDAFDQELNWPTPEFMVGAVK